MYFVISLGGGTAVMLFTCLVCKYCSPKAAKNTKV